MREEIDTLLDSYSQALAEQREHPDDPAAAQKVEELKERLREQKLRGEIDGILETYHRTLALQKEHPDDPQIAQDAGEIRARLVSLSSQLPHHGWLDASWSTEVQQIATDAESNNLRRRFTDTAGDPEDAAVEAKQIQEGEQLLKNAFDQKPDMDVDATFAARAAQRVPEAASSAHVPDSRDLSYGSLAAAAEMDNVTVELPVDTESIERDFETHYRRIGNLVVGARRILHDTSITANAALNDLVDRCVEHLAEMLVQRRARKEAFGNAVRAKRPSEARKVIIDDLKRIGHPGDTPLVADSNELTADMTYFTVLNFFESNLERLIRKSAKKQ